MTNLKDWTWDEDDPDAGKEPPDIGNADDLGREMLAGLIEFADALEAGEDITKRWTVRTVKLDIPDHSYGPDDVKAARKTLGASQALLAKFLGVSANAVRSWEQGTRPVPRIACRYLDDILAHPTIWENRIKVSTS